jgi:hypothetical protein
MFPQYHRYSDLNASKVNVARERDKLSSVASILSVAFRYPSAEAVIMYHPNLGISFSYFPPSAIIFTLVFAVGFQIDIEVSCQWLFRFFIINIAGKHQFLRHWF